MSVATVPLSEVAATKGLVGGPFGSSLVNKDYTVSGIPVIRGANLGRGRHLGGAYAYVSEEKVARDLSKNVAAPGDVIFTQRGTLGQVALVPDDSYSLFVVSQSQMRLRVDPSKANAQYVYYACASQAFLKQIEDNAISTGVPHINLGILNRLTIPLPELPEQQAIAELLGTLDDKITANNKVSVTASELMVCLLAPYPARIPLSERVVHRRTSINPENVSVKNVAHYSLPAFDTDQCPEVSSPESIKSNKFAIAKPSVLISKLNPRFPRIWNLATLPSIPALASTEFLVLEPKEDSTAVICAALSQPSFGTSLQSQVSGTSSSHQRVRPNDLLATPITDLSLVPTAVKCQIAALGSRVEATRTENRILAFTRDTLLPQLMSGKLLVKDAEKVLEDAGV